MALGYSGAVIASAAVGFIAMPVATRVFSAEALGRVGVFNAWLMALQVGVLFGLDQAYLRFRGSPDSRGGTGGLLRRCLVVSGGILAMVGAGVVAFRSEVAIAVVGEPHLWVPFALTLAVGGAVAQRYASIETRVSRRVWAFAVVTVGSTLLTRGLYIMAGFLPSAVGLEVLLLGIGYCAAGVLAIACIWKTLGEPKSPTAIPLGSIFRFSTPFVVSGSFSLVSVSLTPIYLSWELGLAQVGQFNSGLALASILSILQVGILSYWIPYVYANAEAQAERIRSVHHAIFWAMVGTGLILILTSGPLFLLVGQEFRIAEQYFGVLLAVHAFNLLAEIGGVGLPLAKRTTPYSLALVAGSCLTLLTLLLTVPTWGMGGAAFSLLAGSALTAIVRLSYGVRHFRPFSSLARPITALTLLVIAACVRSVTFSLDLGMVGEAGILIAILVWIGIGRPEIRTITLLLRAKHPLG
ncbi:MAG: oligosaccharide flippase family protein [Propionicimonas sp.]